MAQTGRGGGGPCLAVWSRADKPRPTSLAAAICQWAVLALWLSRKAGCDAPGLEDALTPVALFCRAEAPPWGGGGGWGFSHLWPVLDLNGACAAAEAHAWPANMAAMLLEDADLRADRNMHEPLYWFCGPETPARLRSLANIKAPRAVDSPCLGATALCLNSAGRRAQVLLRSSPRPGHGDSVHQAESLSFSLSLDLHPVVISPGVVLGGPMEPFTKSRRSGNGPLVDGLEPKSGGVVLEGLEQKDSHAFVSATFDGYKYLADPVVLRRRLHIDASRGVLNIVDQLDSKQSHTVEINLLLDADSDAQQTKDGLWVVCGAFGVALVRPEPRATCELVRGRGDPALGWAASPTGDVVPAPVLHIACQVVGQASLTTSIVWGQG